MTTTTKPKSWRDVLPIHPAAEMFPRMNEAALRELGEDIKKYGLEHPVVLFVDEDDEQWLLDGVNRLDAMERVGLPTIEDDELHPNVEWTAISFDDEDPYGYVISVNLHRRHLTSEQRRDLIAKLLIATPEKSNRQIAEEAKSNRTTVGQIRKKLEISGDVSIVDTRTDSKGRQQPAHKPPTPPAAATKRTTESDQPSCSFCGKGPEQVSTLIVSQENHVAICNECVDLCVGVIAERKKTASHVAEADPPPEMVECPKYHGTGNMDDDGIPGFLRRQPS